MSDVDLKALVGRLDAFCTDALTTAAGRCVSRGHYEITVEHVLLACVEKEHSDIPLVFKAFDIDTEEVKRKLNREIDGLRDGNSGKPNFSPTLLSWFKASWTISSLTFNLTQIRSVAMLMALLYEPRKLSSGDYTDMFTRINPQQIKNQFVGMLGDSVESGSGLGGDGVSPAAQKGMEQANAGRDDDSFLGRYCTDFTARAREGLIDPVFGRDREIRQMIDILARRRKNNPICVGEPGVGKTAVVEGLALRIIEDAVPDILRGVDLLGLDMGMLQAGASVKGEFEKRLKGVIDEVKSSEKPIVTFIDEAHTLIGAGNQTGGGDAANLLKPALARGELRTIAATTWSEYKKYFEKDAALARRFQLVALDEPDAATTTTMLRGLREKFELAHGVLIRDEALVAAAELGERYIQGRQHPDKGVDLIDTACARVKIALTNKPGELLDIEERIATIDRTLSALRRDRDSGGTVDAKELVELESERRDANEHLSVLRARWEEEQAAAATVLELRKKVVALSPNEAKLGETRLIKKPQPADGATAVLEASEAPTADGTASVAAHAAPAEPAMPAADPQGLRQEYEAALRELREIQGDNPLIPVEVTKETVGAVVSDWTGIPIGKMVKDEAKQLLEFEHTLRERIKGQNHVADILGTNIRAAKAGVKDPNTPIGVFLFVGTSGVGKTETALTVADLLFGGERFLITVNMSEFQEKHTVSRLIGSPPGYVGYGEGGMLTEAVRQRPYSVVLLDEVEKAHPDVLNLFYQVFDKGVLSDGEGREVDFKNTVVILTSNLATDIIHEACVDEESRPNMEELAAKIRPELNAWFKPALLARMSVVPFFPITGSALKEITRLKLNRLVKRLWDAHRMTLTFTDAVIDAIAARCREVETGARNIDHIMRGTLMPQISQVILQRMTEGDLPESLAVGIDDGTFTYAFV